MSVSELSSRSTLISSTTADTNIKSEINSHTKDTSKIQLHSSFSSVSLSDSIKSNQTYTCSDKEEKKLIRALDLRVIPLFCLFYFADSLDTANIGNATIAGLEGNLQMSSSELSTAISAFFITYIIFEVPSNYILKKTNAAKWLSFIMLVWGITTLLTAFVSNFTGLVIARLILGAAESGYVPGIMYLLSKIYKPKEFGFRVGILISMAALSGLVSGPLTYATAWLDGRNGLKDWQYVYIFEGAPTIILSFVSYLCLFNDVKEVSWLSNEQKQLQLERMSISQYEDLDKSNAINLSAFKIVFEDWKTWAFSFVCMLHSINVTSITVFAPVLIDGFGFPPLTSQLLTAPPFAVATVAVLLGGYLSGKYEKRSALLSIGSLTIAVGYLCLLVLYDKWALYGALFIIPAGAGIQAAASIGWSALNYSNLTVRAIAVAFVLMVGNTGSIIAAYLFNTKDGPRYVFAVVFNMIAALMSASASALIGFFLYRENIRMDQDPMKHDQFRYFY